MAARFAFLDAPKPLAFAHRGGAAHGDENTVLAFERAIDLGFRYVETDVRTTADGVPVVFHDDSLQRVAGQRGKLADLTWQDLAAVRVGGEHAVPRLDEVLDRWPEIRFNLDVKADAAVDPLIEVIRRTGAADRVLIGSFSPRRVARVRAAFGPRLATALTRDEAVRIRLASLGRSGRRRAVPPVPAVPPAAAAAQVPLWFRVIPVVDARFIRCAHARGVDVHVWTVDDPAEINRLLDLGVDGIMTDRPDVLRDVLTARGVWRGNR